MTLRDLDDNIKNSDIEFCISEYVRPYSHREMLRKHWFEQTTISDLAAEYHLSETSIKKIIYGIGDKVLLKASKM